MEIVVQIKQNSLSGFVLQKYVPQTAFAFQGIPDGNSNKKNKNMKQNKKGYRKKEEEHAEDTLERRCGNEKEKQ